MRKGSSATLALSKKGQLMAFSTGSSPCAEHECGSAPMQRTLCQGQALSDEAVAGDLRRHKGLAAFVFPTLAERKAINQNLDRLSFVEGLDPLRGEPSAVFGYNLPANPLDHRELSTFNKTTDAVGAWAEDCFAIRVFGARWVKKLARFAEKAQAGDALFAGLFLEHNRSPRFSGVTLALQSELRPEHRAAIKVAQAEWEQRILLKARSRVDELHNLCWTARRQGNAKAQLPGYIWPVWKNNEVGSQVLYRVNPDREARFKTGGPFSYEQLAEWVLAETKVAPLPYAA